ncbi:MAG TPA: nicotinate-nucleotide--dimethylbenzimidazole phosphoribosyltransferase [Pyrinomonadaceae bacterium]|nr:nicotinate-nucleotide--dimethylbenzimidazole phosphoribosyltransferase [Pyrinomonadaceae bacterium]
MNLINETTGKIEPVETVWRERAAARQLKLTKPPGSLGRLEEIADRLCAIQRSLQPIVENREIFVFAASHGVSNENVSPYPASVTAQMVFNFLRGGAAINALAKTANARLTVVDIGVDGDFNETQANFVRAKVARGTKNFALGAAMSQIQMQAAVETGIELAVAAKKRNTKIIGLGEMGIGNTTAASAITAALLGIAPENCVGRGTGADDAMLAHKIEIVRRALDANQLDADDAFDVLRKVGGFEIAGLVGLCLGAARERMAIITDGFITTAAVALAVKICPAVRDYVFASHLSVECGHSALLDFINQKPLFDFEMRLGEGTGAALAMNVVAASVAAFNEMATFKSANVSNK